MLTRICSYSNGCNLTRRKSGWSDYFEAAPICECVAARNPRCTRWVMGPGCLVLGPFLWWVSRAVGNNRQLTTTTTVCVVVVSLLEWYGAQEGLDLSDLWNSWVHLSLPSRGVLLHTVAINNANLLATTPTTTTTVDCNCAIKAICYCRCFITSSGTLTNPEPCVSDGICKSWNMD